MGGSDLFIGTSLYLSNHSTVDITWPDVSQGFMSGEYEYALLSGLEGFDSSYWAQIRGVNAWSLKRPWIIWFSAWVRKFVVFFSWVCIIHTKGVFKLNRIWKIVYANSVEFRLTNSRLSSTHLSYWSKRQSVKEEEEKNHWWDELSNIMILRWKESNWVKHQSQLRLNPTLNYILCLDIIIY